jgi:uncharacterized coiled-coil protein SlyX
MDLEAKVEYLETLNKNQEETIKSLTKEIDLWDRHSRKLQARIDKYTHFLDTLVDECEGSMLYYQYRWVTKRIGHFLSELHDDQPHISSR